MFGENPIIGQSMQKMDEKGRITLPKYTHAEPGDKIALMYDLKRTKIIVFTLMEFEKKLEEIGQRIDELYKTKQISYDERMWFQRYIYGDGCLEPPDTIGKGRRIVIPSRAVKKLNLRDEVFVIGNESRLEIYPTEEAYTLSLKGQKNV